MKKNLKTILSIAIISLSGYILYKMTSKKSDETEISEASKGGKKKILKEIRDSEGTIKPTPLIIRKTTAQIMGAQKPYNA